MNDSTNDCLLQPDSFTELEECHSHAGIVPADRKSEVGIKVDPAIDCAFINTMSALIH